MTARMFPVIRDQSRLPRAERDAWPASIPWAIVEPWRRQAERNHEQTLEELARRGGLSPREIWLAAHGLGCSRIRDITESAAGAWLRGEVAQFEVDEIVAANARQPTMTRVIAARMNHPTSSESSP